MGLIIFIYILSRFIWKKTKLINFYNIKMTLRWYNMVGKKKQKA